MKVPRYVETALTVILSNLDLDRYLFIGLQIEIRDFIQVV